MRAPHLLLIIACSVLGISGCSNDSGPVTPAPSPGTITGSVSDVMGRPIGGVSIETTPTTVAVISASDGSFTIPNVSAGGYALRLTRGGFDTTTISATVQAGQAASVAPLMKETGLVAAWSFNGSAADVSGRSHDGVATGPVLSADRFGAAARAYRFDGDDVIAVAHADDLVFSLSDFSLSAWVRLDGAQDDYAGILSKCTPTAPEYGYQLIIREPAHFGMQIGARVPSGRSYFDVSVPDPLTVGTWHFVTMTVTRRDRTVRLYVDGLLQSTEVNENLAFSMMQDEPLYMGRERQAARWFKGFLDDVRIFNRALSGNEVAELAVR